jgi:YggT family protein
MHPFGQIADLISVTGFSIYITLVWLRFLLQLVHADFYDPFAQYIVKATSPVLHPLRRVVPAIGGMDMAALLLVVVLRMVELVLLSLVHQNGMPQPFYLLIQTLFSLLSNASTFYFWLLLVRVILSWVSPGGYNSGAVLVYQLTEPLMAPCRRLLPPAGGIDFSILLVFVGLKIFDILVMSAFSTLLKVMY